MKKLETGWTWWWVSVITEKSTYKTNSVLNEFRKRISEDVFIKINKRHLPANKYDIETLDIK